MKENLIDQIMALKDRPLAEIQAKYEELFKGENPVSDNKAFLWRVLLKTGPVES